MHFVNPAARPASALGEAKVGFTHPGEIFLVIPSLRGIDFGMTPLGPDNCRLVVQKLVGRIEKQNSLAGVAHNRLLPGADLVIRLRTQHDGAAYAFVIEHFGKSGAAELRYTLVVAEKV